MRSFAALLAMLPLGALAAPAALPARPDIEAYPHQVLSNGVVKLWVFLPDAEKGYYRGARFDWSGVIGRAEYAGHSYYGEWRGPHNPANHDDITGPADEFGFSLPVGYAETEPGQPFIKIGVGQVRKAQEPAYRFSGAYPVTSPGAWSVTHGDRWVRFVQDLHDDRGWAYHYEKRIELDRRAPRFTISHRLENRGTREIDQDHYCHNFTSIDGARIGPAYRITLPFTAPERQALGQVGQVEGDQITFTRNIPEGGSVQALLQGLQGDASDNAFTIRNVESGAGLRMKGDTPLLKFNFWSASTAACPEPFLHIRLKPGEKQEWRNTYDLFTLPGVK